MNLDFSKLSPMTRFRVCEDLSHRLHAEAGQIEGDLKNWPQTPSGTREQMEGWAKAARDLAMEVNEVRKQ